MTIGKNTQTRKSDQLEMGKNKINSISDPSTKSSKYSTAYKCVRLFHHKIPIYRGSRELVIHNILVSLHK